MPMYADSVGGDFRLMMYKVDVNTGWAERIERGSEKTIRFLMDGHGKMVARLDQEKNPLVDHVLANRGGDWTEIASFDVEGGKSSGIAGVMEDGAALAQALIDEKSGITGLAAMPLAGGKSSMLHLDPKYDIGGYLADVPSGLGAHPGPVVPGGKPRPGWFSVRRRSRLRCCRPR